MGLDVYFIKRPADTTRREQDEAVGYYRKFNALLNWIDANAGEVENCTDVPLTRHDLEKLRGHPRPPHAGKLQRPVPDHRRLLLRLTGVQRRLLV